VSIGSRIKQKNFTNASSNVQDFLNNHKINGACDIVRRNRRQTGELNVLGGPVVPFIYWPPLSCLFERTAVCRIDINVSAMVSPTRRVVSKREVWIVTTNQSYPRAKLCARTLEEPIMTQFIDATGYPHLFEYLLQILSFRTDILNRATASVNFHGGLLP